MNQMTILHDGKLYAGFSEADLVTAGVPPAAIGAAHRSLRREAVKAECRRRIYGVGSAEAQINVTAMAAAASAKTASARSAAETALLGTAQASIEWVMAMRTRFAELAEDADADYLDDARWPACPPAVVSLYTQF